MILIYVDFDAIEELQAKVTILKSSPSSDKPLALSAFVHLCLNQFKEARELVEAALSLNATSMMAINVLGWLGLVEQLQENENECYFDKNLERHSRDAEVRIHLSIQRNPL